MKKNAILAACVFALAAVIATIADYTPVTREGSAAAAISVASVTASGAVQGATLNLSSTEYFDVVNTTQLVFIANSGATTNVIDADITN